MTALSAPIVKEFNGLCNRAYEVWLTHRYLFDEDMNPHAEELRNSFAGETLILLSIVTQEYFLHQIAKLHDPAVQRGQINLTVGYIVEFGAWCPQVLSELKAMQVELDVFAMQLKSARNKLLSHNDLATILSDTTLGGFGKSEDESYFSTLQKFVNKVHAGVIGGPDPFNDLAINNVAGFLRMLRQ